VLRLQLAMWNVFSYSAAAIAPAEILLRVAAVGLFKGRADLPHLGSRFEYKVQIT